jgi:hypothetical protein
MEGLNIPDSKFASVSKPVTLACFVGDIVALVEADIVVNYTQHYAPGGAVLPAILLIQVPCARVTCVLHITYCRYGLKQLGHKL